MLKQRLEDEKDALQDRLSALKDFYDKQKQMLQDQYDEENYIRDQNEKRKSVEDIRAELARLQFDDSAWARKRRAELEAQLAEAEQDLEDFERQHALELALGTLDDTYEAQEAEIQAQIDALDEELNNPELLFNQALAAIQGDTSNLYQEMLEWNRLHGTGNDDDVTEIWNNIYEALLNYYNYFGEWFEGIHLPNSGGYEGDGGSWDSSPISGTNPGNGSGGGSTPPSTPPPSEPAQPEETYPYGKASETTGIIKYTNPMMTGQQVKAVQYALNKLGYGNSGTSSVDGRFGKNTEKAVKAFQAAMGLTPDGKVGNQTRNKFALSGYWTGTRHAIRGWHKIDELGPELTFESKDGSRYKYFSGGEQVLTAKQSKFLYDFAINGDKILERLIRKGMGGRFDDIRPPKTNFEIQVGGITIQGNVDQPTISELRRVQRDNLNTMLRELKRLNNL